MKHTRHILLGIAILAAAQLAGSGCAGYVGGGGGVVYGPDVWVGEGGWLDGGGRGWYGSHPGAYAHPDRGHAPAAHAAPAHEEHR
jgi:hypothetical protein